MEAKKRPTEGVNISEPDKAAVLKTALILYHINAVYTSRGGKKLLSGRTLANLIYIDYGLVA